MSKAVARIFVSFVLFILSLAVLQTGLFAQATFTAGNLVVAVEGCGVHGGTCTNIPNGTGTGAGNSSVGGYGDNQAAPLTLFQYSPNGTSSVSFVNSMVLPQSASGANVAISGEYGSSSEASVNLSGGGQYLTIMGYGIDAASFNANPSTYGSPSAALAQSVSLTGQSGVTAVPRVVTLIDANGNVNSSTAIFNIFNTNNPRGAFTLNGSTAYVSGQGVDGDATQGIFFVPVGAITTSPTTITGLDATDSNGNPISQDTRVLQIFNNTLYVSVDTKGGKNSARSFIGTLGTPPATSLYSSAAGPTQLNGFGTTKTGKLVVTTGTNSNGNPINSVGPKSNQSINLSPVNYFFASPTVLYVADSGFPKNDSNGDDNSSGKANLGDGGLQKWVNVSGTWTLEYTLYQGLNLVNNGSASGTTGLYGLAGTVSGNTVNLYATNYTIGDLDPTYLYGITDNLSFTTATQAAGEIFTQLEAAPADSNFKGVSFAPTIPAGSVEVTTVPSGLSFTSSGTGCAPGSYTSPVTLAWTPGSGCTLTVATPQAGGTGTQYAFSNWEDETTSTSHIVTAPATTATYTATYNTQYQLTTAAGTGGSVSAGGFFTAGTDAIITATPSTGYYFNNFTGTSTSSNNPFSLLMDSPQSITANFLPQGSQTITFTTNAPASAAYGSQFTVAATGGPSGNPVVFTSSGACTNSGAIYTMTSATGSCSVIANQAGNADYLAAPTVTQTTNATQSTTTVGVTSVSPSAEDYGQDATITITAVLSWSGLGTAPSASSVMIAGNGPSGYGVTSCSAPSGATMSCTNTYTPSGLDTPGTYTESATFSGDNNYSASSSTQSNNFTINQATTTTTVSSNLNPSSYNQSVTFTATIGGEFGPQRRRKGGIKPPDVSGSVTWSDNTGCGVTQVTTGTPGIATCTTSSLTAGTDTISATYSGDSNHSGSAGTLSGGQVVNQASQTITFTTNAPASAAYGTSFTIAASASSRLPVAYSSTGQCTNSGATFTITNASGMCNLTANQSGNSNYLAASPVRQSTNTTRANPTVTFTGAPATAPYQSMFTLTATTNSTAVAVITTNNPNTCSLSGQNSPATVTVLKDVGMCKFTASWQADDNYNAAATTQTTTATKAPSSPTISWTTPAAITYGTPLSSTQLDASSTLAGNFTYMPGAGKIEPVGTFTLNTTFRPTNMNYATGTASTTLEVLQASTTTAITSSSSTVRMNTSGVAYATLDFNVTSYKPTGKVTLEASTGEICSANVSAATGNGGCKLTFTTTGTRTITATYSGDSNHSGSNSSGQSPAVTVTVNPH